LRIVVEHDGALAEPRRHVRDDLPFGGASRSRSALISTSVA
jgi:hypothetical protein